MKPNQRKAMFAVQKKSVYTDHKWQDVSKHDSLPSASVKADYIQSSKFIVGKDWTGQRKPQPKQQVRIMKL